MTENRVWKFVFDSPKICADLIGFGDSGVFCAKILVWLCISLCILPDIDWGYWSIPKNIAKFGSDLGLKFRSGRVGSLFLGDVEKSWFFLKKGLAAIGQSH